MRTIKTETVKAGYFVTDWNFKRWYLSHLTDGGLQCDELRARFDSLDSFLVTMYGSPNFRQWDGKVFINYKLINE